MSVPSLPSASFDSPRVPGDRRPGKLTAVCVIALVLGGLGLLAALWGTVALVGGARLQQSMTMTPQGPGADRVIVVQREMQQKLQAVNDRHRLLNAVILLVNVCMASALLVGAIMALKRAPQARAVLLAVFAVAIPFEIARDATYAVIQWEVAEVTADFMPRMMEASAPAKGPQAQQAAAMGAAFARVGIIIGLGFWLLFGLVKVTYYAVSWFYVRGAAVRAWLERADEGFAAAGPVRF